MKPEEIDALLSKVNDTAKAAVETKLKEANHETLTKEQVEKMIADAVEQTAELATLKEQVNSLANIVKGLKEAGHAVVNTVASEIKSMATKLREIASGRAGNDMVELKTLVQRSSIANNAQAYDLPDIGQLATRKLVLYDLFPKITLGSNNNGTVRYYDWDADTIARAAAAVAEGGTFPESTAAWVKNTVDLKKIGDSLPVTEEFFEDEEMFAAELGMFLETNVKLALDQQLATGDGTSNKLTGIVTSSTAFTPVASGIQAPTIYDLIIKMSEAITKTGGSKFQPDFALLNITDINRMKLSKDHNDNYILPPFVSPDGTRVGTIYVIECNAIKSNECVVGDRRYARIYEKPGVVIQKGVIDQQFLKDEMTIKASKRTLFLIRACDKPGFSHCSDIDAALTTLGS